MKNLLILTLCTLTVVSAQASSRLIFEPDAYDNQNTICSKDDWRVILKGRKNLLDGRTITIKKGDKLRVAEQYKVVESNNNPASPDSADEIRFTAAIRRAAKQLRPKSSTSGAQIYRQSENALVLQTWDGTSQSAGGETPYLFVQIKGHATILHFDMENECRTSTLE